MLYDIGDARRILQFYAQWVGGNSSTGIDRGTGFVELQLNVKMVLLLHRKRENDIY